MVVCKILENSSSLAIFFPTRTPPPIVCLSYKREDYLIMRSKKKFEFINVSDNISYLDRLLHVNRKLTVDSRDM